MWCRKNKGSRHQAVGTWAMQRSEPFSISDAALEKIRSQLDQFRKRFGKEAVPAITWIDAALNGNRFPSQPAIGFYDDIDSIRDDLIVVSGLQCVLAVSDDDKVQFLGKTLNVRDGKFVID
jgi:hypothetical protein